MKVGRLTLVLLLLCAGLGAWVFQQWMAYQAAAPAPLQQAAAGTPSGGGVRAPDPPPMAPLASYSEIVERPLFVQTRRPPPEAEVAQAAAPNPPGNYRLEGTALTPVGRVAVVRNTRTSALHRLAVGDEVDGWQLEEVEPGQAALSQGPRKLQLELEWPTSTPVR
jgi:hypothetical protein